MVNFCFIFWLIYFILLFIFYLFLFIYFYLFLFARMSNVQARDEWKDYWGKLRFPMVPGHEIAGHVISIGANVSKFQIGQKVGVGCMVDSCRDCRKCRQGEEQY